MSRPPASEPDVAAMLAVLASAAPHTHALGFALEGVETDVVTLRMPWREDLVGDPETQVLAGGAVTAMLDHVSGLAVWLKLGRFTSIATLDLRIDYMRAAKPHLPLFARARCFKVTRSIAFVRGWAYDEDPDDPVAAAQSSFVIDSDGERKAGANLATPRPAARS